MTSILEERFTLRELLDAGVMREVCESFSSCFNVGLSIISQESEELVSVSQPREFCKIINANDNRQRCEEAKKRLIKHPVEGAQVLQLKTNCGMRYALLPLSYQLEPLGRIIVGPFRNPETPLGKIINSQEGAIKQCLDEDIVSEVPAFEPEALKAMISLLAKILNAFLFVNAKRLITTKLHLETIYSSREKIFKDVELQDSGSAEDKAEIEKYKDMF